jgi:hypothetical protein
MKTTLKRWIVVAMLALFTIAGAMLVSPNPASAASSSGVQIVPNIPFGSTASGGAGLPPAVKVPSTRHLVIETLSVQVDVTPSGSQVEAQVTYKSGGKIVYVFLPLTFAYTAPSTNFDTYVATQAVRLYADPGTSVTFSPYTATGSIGTPFMTVSGYLF